MKKTDKNYAADIKKLREMEYGERFEPGFRLLSVWAAGVLLYIYTGWVFALLWALYFLASFGAHVVFLASRKSFVARYEVIIAALLFANFQIGYASLPAMMFVGPDRPLVLVGGSLIGAQLLFMVRRSDTLAFYNVAQVGVVFSVAAAIYVSFIPSFDRPLAFVGAALALFALIFYFFQSMRFSRRMWISRQEAAEQAHQAQKMAAIGQLAGGVAHDFNNNLTAIIGSLELAQMAENTNEQHADLENALVAARQAATTVKQLMIFARKEKPLFSVIELFDLFAELERLTSRLIPVSVTFQVTMRDAGLLIHADRNLLLSGLINLVVNSVDALPEGGSVWVTSGPETTDKDKPMADGSVLAAGRYAMISVSDNGQGIPEAILSKVLDPFFTTKPVGKGTGLGLSMVAGMLVEFGGGLTISSGTEGTRVDLYLPIADGAVAT